MRLMKDSGIRFIGEIPYNWSIFRNKYIFQSNKKLVGNSFSRYQLLSLTTKGVVEKDVNNRDGKLPESFTTYQSVKKNDIVLCLFDLDVSAVFSGISNYNGMISPAYKIISSKEKLLPKYTDYWFRMIGNDRSYLLYSKSLRNTINDDNFKDIPTVVPQISEQKVIINYLDQKVATINNIIVKTKESIDEYEKLKQSIITETITKGLNPNVKMKDSGIKWIGEIPEHWSVSYLKYLGSLQNGVSKGGEFFGTGLPFVSYSDVYKNYQLPLKVEGLFESNEEDIKKYSVIQGDVLFTRTSETIEEIGLSAICTETIEKAVFGGFIIRFRPYRKNDLDNLYSKFYFRSEIHRRFFVKEMNIVTRASLSQELLKKLPVILPPIKEQIIIGEYLQKKCILLDKQLLQKENLIRELESYKKSLIYEVVTGKMEIK